MGGSRSRLRRLEGPPKPERCPECSGRIVFAEHLPDGTVRYPMGGPCSMCGNRSADGSIRLIRVMLSDEDSPEERRA